MRYDAHLVAGPWDGYELIDSGDGEKLERFGTVVLARPETQALWAKRQPAHWREAAATFTPASGTKGSWRTKRPLPEPWLVPAWRLTLAARLTAFKHVGIFPEQAPNWGWIRDCVRAISTRLGTVSEGARNGSHTVSVLNLFGYTGAASIAAAIGGAHVTHVDASKQSLDWAHENARLSGLAEDAIRWLPDDALAFVRREVRRKATYDGIILDPPAFGRGPKGEVWHIERGLPTLLAACSELLAKKPGAFFLVNGYAAGYAPRSLAQAVESAFGALPTSAEAGELHIQEAGGTRVIPAGIYCRFVR